MKSALIFLFLCMCSFNSFAQVVDIPDPNFLQALIRDGVDSNGDGMIQVSEAEAVTSLEVDDEAIDSLTGIDAFINLTGLVCYNNNLTSLDVGGLVNLTELVCGNNNLTSLDVTSLVNLTYLDCSINNLTSLDLSNLVNLTFLECAVNNLTSLDVDNLVNLTDLGCSSNNLTSLDVSNLVSLTYLTCSTNNLTSLEVSTLLDLIELDCSTNNLTSLDVSSLTNLEWLECYSNNLTSLDVSNLVNMIWLDCFSNDLTSLEMSGLVNLILLNCRSNNLASLDVSGLNNLMGLRCDSNILDELDVSNLDALFFLICGQNNISDLDVSEANALGYIKCDSMPSLKTLNVKNGKDYSSELGFLIVSDTLILSGCDSLEYICVDEEDVNYVQEQLDLQGIGNCTINSYCSFTPGGDFYTINGNVRYNQNGDGCDSLDQPVPYTYFSITNGMDSGQFISNASGYYEVYVKDGIHTVKAILDNPDYFNITPDSAIIEFPSDTNLVTQNFCLTPAGNFPDVGISILPITAARPGFESTYRITYFNSGTDTLSDDFTLSYEDDLIDYVNSTETPSDDSPSLLTWTYEDLAPFERRNIEVTMLLNTPTDDPPLTGGEVLEFTATINPIGGDANDQDNEFILNQTVVNSYDPNDKTCLQGDIIKPELIGEYVDYLIRFENTGTASAVNVVVKDVIDETRFDVSSLRVIDASHKVDTRISEGNTVEFIFENIELPFEDDSNDGYVLFKIKTLSTLSIGDVLTNDAEIFFDFNPAIETNVASSEINVITVNEEEQDYTTAVELFPNPTESGLTISSEFPILRIEYTDASGRLLQSTAFVNKPHQVTQDLSLITKGVLFLKIHTTTSEQVRKVIVR